MSEIRHVEGVVVDRHGHAIAGETASDGFEQRFSDDPRLFFKFSRVMTRQQGPLGWILGGPLRLALGLVVAVPLIAVIGTLMTIFFLLSLLFGRKQFTFIRR